MTQLSKRHRLTVELRLLIVLLLVELVLNILDRVHVHEVAEAGVVHQLLIIEEAPRCYLARSIQHLRLNRRSKCSPHLQLILPHLTILTQKILYHPCLHLQIPVAYGRFAHVGD